jgi:hypothetical protein
MKKGDCMDRFQELLIGIAVTLFWGTVTVILSFTKIPIIVAIPALMTIMGVIGCLGEIVELLRK